MVQINSIIKAAAPGCKWGVMAIKIKDSKGLHEAVKFLEKIPGCKLDYLDMLHEIIEESNNGNLRRCK